MLRGADRMGGKTGDLILRRGEVLRGSFGGLVSRAYMRSGFILDFTVSSLQQAWAPEPAVYR